MHELVALDVASASEVASMVRREWDAGNAVLVVDQRLPHAAKRQLFEKIGVHTIVTADERTHSGLVAAPMNDGDAVVISTSGTSGEPKGVVHTHAGLRAASLASSAALCVGADAHWLACLPLAHIGGFGVLTRAWHTGARLTIHDGFDATNVGASDATHVSLVPTALTRIDPSRFTRILLGGSRPPDSLPSNTTVTYGLSESCGGVVYDRRPIPGVSVAIADDGEILLRGPMIMSRYVNPDLASPIDNDGWLHTNDFGSITDGLLHVDGRRGEMIITGGENVWPDAVERALVTHPSISECAVAGMPDVEWGQVVTAWIVVDGEEPSLEEVQDHVCVELPRYCAPRRLIVVSSLPRTSLGKVRRRDLVEELTSRE